METTAKAAIYSEQDPDQKILEASFAFPNALGAGFLEKVDANALLLEWRQMGFVCVQAVPCKRKDKDVIVRDYSADLSHGDASFGRTEGMYGTRLRAGSADPKRFESKRDSRRLADEFRQTKIGTPKVRTLNLSWNLSVSICGFKGSSRGDTWLTCA
jgi:hypothetical protein